MLYYLENDVDKNNSEKANKLKEKYLEVIVNDKGIEEERFHTILAQNYLEVIFKI
jgi:hypothetical protein